MIDFKTICHCERSEAIPTKFILLQVFFKNIAEIIHIIFLRSPRRFAPRDDEMTRFSIFSNTSHQNFHEFFNSEVIKQCVEKKSFLANTFIEIEITKKTKAGAYM